MAENSNIEWTDHTFNPWIGCTKVSPGCKNCYAETLMAKRYKRVEWGPQGRRVRTSKSYWRKPLAWNRKAEAAGTRARVFCASLADVFEDKPDQRDEMDNWRADLFDLIWQTPRLDWLLLTKRPESVHEIIERVTGFSDVLMWMPQNVWIGTSVENQEQALARIPELLKIPAGVRFLSVEPMLEEIDLGFGGVMPNDWTWLDANTLDWVIVGGESGPGKRPFNPDWARSLRDQCIENGVPFFMKQMDKKRPIPLDLKIRQFPLGAAWRA